MHASLRTNLSRRLYATSLIGFDRGRFGMRRLAFRLALPAHGFPWTATPGRPLAGGGMSAIPGSCGQRTGHLQQKLTIDSIVPTHQHGSLCRCHRVDPPARLRLGTLGSPDCAATGRVRIAASGGGGETRRPTPADAGRTPGQGCCCRTAGRSPGWFRRLCSILAAACRVGGSARAVNRGGEPRMR
jgi:hypothetical protein